MCGNKIRHIMNKKSERLTGSPPSRRAATVRNAAQRLFELDGSYILLTGGSTDAAGMARIAAQWPDCHVSAIVGVPDGTGEWAIAELGRAAQAFDRIVICESANDAGSGDIASAARLARAVRSAGRTECQVVADAHRALRHCVECMVPGEVIAYCFDDTMTASRILAEYGALPVRDNVPVSRTIVAGTHVALNGTTGELTARRA